MTADALRRENRRLDDELLEAATSVDPAHLHFAPEGEWSLAQVLAHLGDFPRFFAGERSKHRRPGSSSGTT